ncbi:hypothetical protein SBDP2_870008 [Syntrophobacter sp. SbD2]|nr:hypothetical protein SBDP2_870008 [Syntrophobacter sp. SbD2]
MDTLRREDVEGDFWPEIDRDM